MSKRLIKKIFKQVRNANLKYDLIKMNDHVAAGLSGGKDSLTLIYFLWLLDKYTPLEFNVIPIHIDLGWGMDPEPLADFCRQLGYDLKIEQTNIGEVVFKARQENNPCSLCANMRRGALNNAAKRLGCNKVALGHHLDDVVNTLFLSMLYEERFAVFKPLTYLDRVDITVIRPLIYVEEKDIDQFIKSQAIQVVENLCPADKTTKRNEISLLLADLENKHPGARRSILRSIENVNENNFWK